MKHPALNGGLLALLRQPVNRKAALERSDLRRLVAVAVFGAALGPVALAWGLQRTSGTGASLMLKMKTLFPAILAGRLYRETMDRRVWLAKLAQRAFASVPLIGAAMAFALGDRSAGWGLALGGVLMLADVIRPLAEQHGHEHEHAAMEHEHEHAHRHDRVHDPIPTGAHSHAHGPEAHHTHPPFAGCDFLQQVDGIVGHRQPQLEAPELLHRQAILGREVQALPSHRAHPHAVPEDDGLVFEHRQFQSLEGRHALGEFDERLRALPVATR